MVISAWFSISGTSLVSAQLTYIASGGIGGLFLLGAGFGLLIRKSVGKSCTCSHGRAADTGKMRYPH
jgi:nitrate reductase gamma subunit